MYFIDIEIYERVKVDMITNQADKPKNLGSYGVLGRAWPRSKPLKMFIIEKKYFWETKL